MNSNGTSTTWSYDPDRGWVDTIVTIGPGGTIQNLQYTHNDDGQVTDVTSPFADEGWTYDHDQWHQLQSATDLTTGPNNQNFDYNDVGSITLNSLVGSYVYQSGHAHAPSSVAGQPYSYDLNGNLLTGGGRTITWNANDMPTLVSTLSGSTTFTYDGTGSRLKKVSGANTTRYPFDDDFEIKNGVITKYIAPPGLGVVAKRVGGSFIPYWLHADALGSIQAMTNGAGTVTRRTFRPYGDMIGDGMGASESRGYIDQRQDSETGLTYLHARYYDSKLGLFLSADPLGAAGGLNLYGYGLSNPINRSDRSGLKDPLACSPLYGDGADCAGGGGWDVFIPGGGFNFDPGSGNSALDNVNRLESRMQNTVTVIIPNADGTTTRVDSDGRTTTTTTTPAPGGQSSSSDSFTDVMGGCAANRGGISCSETATVTAGPEPTQTSELFLLGLDNGMFDPSLIGGRAPYGGNYRLLPNETFNEGFRNARPSGPRIPAARPGPPPSIGPRLDQQVPRMPLWFKILFPWNNGIDVVPEPRDTCQLPNCA